MFDIITIGTATRDVFLTSKLFKVIKDPEHLKKIGILTGEAECFALGSKIEIEKPIFTTGGGAANAAVTFARQGLKTASLMRLGKDPEAESILKELKKEKVFVFPVFDKNLSTGYSAILLSPNGERTILAYRGASHNLKATEIPFDKISARGGSPPKADAPMEHASGGKSRWAYISPGNIPFPTLLKIYSHLEKQNTLIAINPSKYLIEMGIKKLEPILSKSKVVILNREEASYLTKTKYQNEKGIFERLDKAVLGIAVMTDGPKGVIVSDGRKIYQAKTFKNKKVVDRTGAGDSFGSGFVCGLISRKEKCDKNKCAPANIAYAIQLGAANATSNLEKIGATEGLLTKNDFEKNPRWKTLKIEINNI